MIAPTKEMILKAKSINGIVKRYGTEDLSSINVLVDEDTVFSFDCDERIFREWSSDSFWDLYESEIMLTVMRVLSPEQVIEIVGENNLGMSSAN